MNYFAGDFPIPLQQERWRVGTAVALVIAKNRFGKTLRVGRPLCDQDGEQHGERRDDVAERVDRVRHQGERVSDDPPERVRGWTATVSEPALDQLDLQMLLDLLRIEDALPQWEPLATIAASEIERRALIGDISGARAVFNAKVLHAVYSVAREGRPVTVRMPE